jgi:aspartyl aminopeptidase
VTRAGGWVVAVRVGSAAPSEAGLRLVGAHTDSPALKVRPSPDVEGHGYRRVGVEPYGGVLLHTWFDRDLTLAGRVIVRDDDGGLDERLVRLPGAPLRIPNLAIHLYRELRSEGLKLDPQRHAIPVWGLDAEPGLRDALGGFLGVEADRIVGHDLLTADTQPPALGGDGDAFVFAPRLDNLASCHAGLAALCGAADTPQTHVLVCNDHEEVGSRTAEGAAGPFLETTLRRLAAACGDDDPQAFAMACARSILVSADMAHAVHPNYADRHEPEHRPRLAGGPVLKVNANQAYASDAATGGWFAARSADAGVALQHFVTRADLPCGSTIGPFTAARLGIATVDVGAPILSMHSCREQGAAADVEPMIAALRAHLEHPGEAGGGNPPPPPPPAPPRLLGGG